MKQFWLIRHGQSTSNIGERIAQRGTPPLTELGWEQARRVGAIFPVEPDLIVQSAFVRAQQSAEPLRARFPHVPVVEWDVQEVTSLPLTAYTNTTGAERLPQIKAFWDQGDPQLVSGDGAESFAATNERAARLLAQLEACSAERIAVFTHGLFMRFVLWVWINGSVARANENMIEFQSFRRTTRVPNTSIIRGVVVGDQLYLSHVLTDHLGKEL